MLNGMKLWGERTAETDRGRGRGGGIGERRREKRDLFAQGTPQGQPEHIYGVGKCCSMMLWLKQWRHKCAVQERNWGMMWRSVIRLLKAGNYGDVSNTFAFTWCWKN